MMTMMMMMMMMRGWGGGVTPDLRRQGRSNGGKNQNPKKIHRGFKQNKKKSLNQNLTPRNLIPNFQAIKIPRKH